jgi:hypothetical protein
MFRATLYLLLVATAVQARPPYRRALLDLLQLPASSRLNDCKTCHLPGKEEKRPHNAFGSRLKALRAERKKAGLPTDIESRLIAAADEDSDGDGVNNLLELLAGSFPGDREDKPSADAIAAARKKREALLKSLAGYRWRPFERVQRPAVPPGVGFRNPIDAFLEAERKKHGLVAQTEAPRHVLLRRVTLDLAGLPPTPDELHAFLSDKRPDAYERVVERLLASPAFGERWGRHWMDVWRYSDWAGYGSQIRDSQPHVWHWRDWIVESLNHDRGYGRMVQEMLAADELAPEDTSALRATGFLVRNYKLLSREKWMQDAVDHTSMAFLGVTLGCARCHDHMYEAITQKEYYRVRAIFAPHNVRTDRLPGFPDMTKNGLPRVYDADLTAKTFLFERGDDRTPGKEPLEPGAPELLGGSLDVKPVPLPPAAHSPERRPFILAELIASLEDTVRLHDEGVRKARLREQLAPLSGVLAGQPQGALAALKLKAKLREGDELGREAAVEVVKKHRLLAVVEKLEDAGKKGSAEWTKAATQLVGQERTIAVIQARLNLLRNRDISGRIFKGKIPYFKKWVADAEKALKSAEAALKAPPSTKYTPRPIKSYPTTSTGRRLAFARWLTSRDNPLAARVAVNHVWARHFGAGLVPGMFDFGKNGPPPTHPALVDWLAVEFMESGWSLKHLHRLIVTSSAYRADSRPISANLGKDADNVFLWRFTPRRVEAEVVRDLVLSAGGKLDRTMGGPEVPYNQGLSVPRRSLYFQHAQEKQMEFLRLFDCASVTEAYLRKQAIVPQQALALANSDFALAHARLAAALVPDSDDNAFIKGAFERMLSRAPTKDEAADCLGFLRAQGKRLTPLRARENLLHVLMNHHEFVTIR